MAKVLIIEDEEGIQTLFRRVIGMLGHDVLVAVDGKTGCRLAEEHDVQLIVTDLSLPGDLEGLDLVRALRARRPGSHLVVSTGYATADRLASIEAEGVRHVLRKPFDMVELRTLVVGLIGDARAK